MDGRERKISVWTLAKTEGRLGWHEVFLSQTTCQTHIVLLTWATRRIERLLITQPADHQQVTALTSGLLLLSLARLRIYAVNKLPLNTRLRDGFLEDLSDLENPDLGRDAKLEIVHRMWRCWGTQLGWERCGELG